MFENPGRGRQARNFTTNVPKILDLKSSSEQIFSRKLALGALGSIGFDYQSFQPRPQGAFPWLWGRGAPKAREKRPGDEVAIVR